MKKIKSKARLLLLTITLGAIAALVGNLVSIEILREVIHPFEFSNPSLQKYLGRIAISFGLVAWLSVFASLYIGRLRDEEARRKSQQQLERFYLHDSMSMVNARWIDQALSTSRDPLSGEKLEITHMKLYVVAWWPKILRYFGDQEKQILFKFLQEKILSNSNIQKNKLGYLGYGIFFYWGASESSIDNYYLEEISFNEKIVTISSFAINVNYADNSYRLAALAQNFGLRIEQGIGRVESVTNSLPVISNQSQSAWEAVLRQDIKFAFQPIYRFSDNKISGFEMLARLSTEDGAPIPITDEVADIFENSPLALCFHRILLRELRDFQEAVTEISPRISISINVPGPILTYQGFWQALNFEIAAGLKLNLMAFELTERTLPVQSSEIESALRKLSGFGAEIHLDDFGAGQSSIETICNYDFELVKIDRALIGSTNWNVEKSQSLVDFLK